MRHFAYPATSLVGHGYAIFSDDSRWNSSTMEAFFFFSCLLILDLSSGSTCPMRLNWWRRTNNQPHPLCSRCTWPLIFYFDSYIWLTPAWESQLARIYSNNMEDETHRHTAFIHPSIHSPRRTRWFGNSQLFLRLKIYTVQVAVLHYCFFLQSTYLYCGQLCVFIMVFFFCRVVHICILSCWYHQSHSSRWKSPKNKVEFECWGLRHPTGCWARNRRGVKLESVSLRHQQYLGTQ